MIVCEESTHSKLEGAGGSKYFYIIASYHHPVLAE